ncbi:unnamed protein product [Citrullus colocynthis]|uniref:Uncharacterized protein n=1 Tax=Citrullus colocynthis TaxID=252529 RepID=A0ABP0XSA1_9ROSI
MCNQNAVGKTSSCEGIMFMKILAPHTALFPVIGKNSKNPMTAESYSWDHSVAASISLDINQSNYFPQLESHQPRLAEELDRVAYIQTVI